MLAQLKHKPHFQRGRVAPLSVEKKSHGLSIEDANALHLMDHDAEDSEDDDNQQPDEGIG